MPENAVPITKWYRLKMNDAGDVISKSFNHYAEGWGGCMYPAPFDYSFSSQVAWQNDLWAKEFTYMTTDKRII